MSDITVTLKDLVRGEVALMVLSTQRTLKGMPACVISKAARKAKSAVGDYRKGVRGILESHGAKPDAEGNLRLNPKANNFKEAAAELDKYNEDILDSEIKLEGLKTLKADELLEAILPEKNKDGVVIREAGAVEPFVLEGIHWLLEE